MNLIKTIKCLCCLIKCSKYIYFIKKALCIATVSFAVIALVCNCGKCRTMLEKLKVM